MLLSWYVNTLYTAIKNQNAVGLGFKEKPNVYKSFHSSRTHKSLKMNKYLEAHTIIKVIIFKNLTNTTTWQVKKNS